MASGRSLSNAEAAAIELSSTWTSLAQTWSCRALVPACAAFNVIGLVPMRDRIGLSNLWMVSGRMAFGVNASARTLRDIIAAAEGRLAVAPVGID